MLRNSSHNAPVLGVRYDFLDIPKEAESCFQAGGLDGKVAIYLVLAYLVELTLLTVIELWADTKRDLSVHCVSALIFAYKSIELVDERLNSWVVTVLLIFHHRGVKRASGTTLIPERAHPFLDDPGLVPDTG